MSKSCVTETLDLVTAQAIKDFCFGNLTEFHKRYLAPDLPLYTFLKAMRYEPINIDALSLISDRCKQAGVNVQDYEESNITSSRAYALCHEFAQKLIAFDTMEKDLEDALSRIHSRTNDFSFLLHDLRRSIAKNVVPLAKDLSEESKQIICQRTV